MNQIETKFFVIRKHNSVKRNRTPVRHRFAVRKGMILNKPFVSVLDKLMMRRSCRVVEIGVDTMQGLSVFLIELHKIVLHFAAVRLFRGMRNHKRTFVDIVIHFKVFFAARRLSSGLRQLLQSIVIGRYRIQHLHAPYTVLTDIAVDMTIEKEIQIAVIVIKRAYVDTSKIIESHLVNNRRIHKIKRELPLCHRFRNHHVLPVALNTVPVFVAFG